MVHFTESLSNPDESRLRKHLFEHQAEDLKTIAIANSNESLNVKFAFSVIKIIALVKTRVFLLNA